MSVLKHITLESILESKSEYFDDFTIYLHNTYCIENLFFWQDVQDYRLSPTFAKYQTMITNYIVADAPHEINIPCDMRQELLVQHTAHCFDDAAESILELIRVNSYLPWIQTYTNDSSMAATSTTTNYARNSLSPSMSFPSSWNLKHQESFIFGRPSFSSLRSPASMYNFRDKMSATNKLSSVFQRKRQALMIRVKKTFSNEANSNKSNGFSWLAKK